VVPPRTFLDAYEGRSRLFNAINHPLKTRYPHPAVKDFTGEFLSPLLLDMIIALGIRFDPEGASDLAAVLAHVDRAHKDLMLELENPKVATMQGLTLLAAWHLGHNKVEAAWTFHGQYSKFPPCWSALF